MLTGRIFSVEEFATFDGPGIRMTVFLKGCPLHCTWCHNPEGQSFPMEFLRSPNGCTGCGACLDAGQRERGTRCLTEASISACPRNLVRRCGEDITSVQLIDRIMKNARLLSGGGVTFSGGEPLAQLPFLLEGLRLLEGRVHRAVQTSGYADSASFSQALSRCDYMLFDLKLMDSAQHKAFCGVDNGLILSNYARLARSGIPFVTRVPLIPTVTDTEENLSAIAEFMTGLGVDYVEVLPYNQLAGSKYSGLLRQYQPGFEQRPSRTDSAAIFARYGIHARQM